MSNNQHTRSNSLASRLSNRTSQAKPNQHNSTEAQLPATSNNNPISQSLQKKSFSAGPIIYPPKSNFDAIKGRFGLTQPINTQSNSPNLSSLGLYRRGSQTSYNSTSNTSSGISIPPPGHQKRFSTSVLDHDASSIHSHRPHISASSLMATSTQSNYPTQSRRPLSTIDPISKINNISYLHSFKSHASSPDTQHTDRSPLEPVVENSNQDTQGFHWRRAHSSNPPHPEADQLIPVGQVEDVVGLHGRLRLSKDLPQSPKSQFNRFSGGLKLLESQRHLLQAYEYLCHVGEAKDWLEAALEMQSDQNSIPASSPALSAPSGSPALPSPSIAYPMDGGSYQLHNLSVTEFEQTLRDGVILARLARRFRGREHVPRIFIHPKLQYRHSDNINYFFQFVRYVRLPELFIFELVDLYNAKNLPKVIYCIHVLSHLLAKRGLAERIGNLVGKLEFSHDQLEQTNAGLVGKSMPNFGDINKELAKECKEEFEVEVQVESESDRIDRELGDLLPEVIGLQSQLRGYLARLNHRTLLDQLEDNLPPTVAFQALIRGCLQRSSSSQLSADLSSNHQSIVAFQAVLRGARCRRKCRAALKLRKELDIWAVALQASSRTRLAQRRFSKLCDLLAKLEFLWIALQAHARGSLARARRTTITASVMQCERAFTGVQALVRARLMTQAVREHKKQLETSEVSNSVVKLQSQIRGLLERRRFYEPIHQLDRHEPAMVHFQSLIRTRLAQAQLGKKVTELIACEDDTVPFQSVCRGALCRRSLLNFIQSLQDCEESTTALQALCRAKLVRRSYTQKAKALNRVEVTRSVGGLQAFVRAGLIRKKIVNQKKQLDFIQPDVLGVQAQCRGVLARLEWGAWFEHVRSSVPTAIFLQSLTRGFLIRREFYETLMHYYNRMDKVIKVQSVYRARQQASQYKALTRRTNVPISAIKTFLHLLSDSDVDYQEEIELSRLRTDVVRLIRDNQQLDGHVNDLDTKIALLVKNKITLDEVQRTSGSGGGRRRRDLNYRNSILAAANDPFAIVASLGGGNLNGSSFLFDKSTKRKLEIYQEFFYLLQTKPEYLSRLFFLIKSLPVESDGQNVYSSVTNQARAVMVTEKVKKVLEGVVLTLFGYAQMRREEYLLLKLFQRSIHEELAGASSLSEFILGKFTFINLLIQYGRGSKERKYLKDILGSAIEEVANHDQHGGSVHVETDPIKIYRLVINEEETRTGIQSSRPLDVTFNEALADQETLGLFIKHLQSLKTLTDRFLYAITSAPRKMPFGIRYIAREIFRGLLVKFPTESEDSLAKVVLHMIYYRYLQPAVVAPETYDVVDSVIGPFGRKNLSEVAKMLNQISVGRLFSDENPYLVPLNDYISQATETFIQWFYAMVDVEDAEVYFAVDEYLDHTVSTKPVIYISPNEIYLTHSLVLQDLDLIAPTQNDPLKALLMELGQAPSAASAELDHARAGEIALPLQNKLAVQLDPEADIKALWVKTKRYVLSMLKAQPGGTTLLEAFLAPVTEEHELEWATIVSAEVELDARNREKRRKSFIVNTTESDHHQTLEDIHCLSFQELKARTLENVLALESRGKLDRQDNYQGILDSLANDILQRNRKRIQRRIDTTVLVNTLMNLKEKQKYLEDQETQYHSYISDSMAAMQKKGTNKKRFVMPFTPQWHHLRTLQKEGKKPKFGSYKYSAQRLYEKGILLSVINFSPKQFDKLFIIISCDEVGIFKVEVRYMDRLISSRQNSSSTSNQHDDSNDKEFDELRMEDLLEDQFSGKQSLHLDHIKLNLNLLLHLINRKFYV